MTGKRKKTIVLSVLSTLSKVFERCSYDQIHGNIDAVLSK